MVSKKNWPKRQTNILNLSKLGQPGPLHCELPGNVQYLSLYLSTHRYTGYQVLVCLVKEIFFYEIIFVVVLLPVLHVHLYLLQSIG